MYIVELTIPGDRLDYPSHRGEQWVRDAESMLTGWLPNSILSAAVALAHFEELRATDQQQSDVYSALYDQLEPLVRTQLKREIVEDLAHKIGETSVDSLLALFARENDIDEVAGQEEAVLDMIIGRYIGYANYSEFEQRISRETLRHMWAQGAIPQDYLRRLKVIYAEAFVFALDRIRKIIDVLAKDAPGEVSDRVKEQSREFQKQFGGLTKVRDTSQHMEDRSRSLGLDREKGGKVKKKEFRGGPINEPGFIYAPQGGVTVLESFNHDYFVQTDSDGNYVGAGINRANLDVAATIVQNTINAYAWRGYPQLIPSG